MPEKEHPEVRNEATVDAPEVWLRGPVPRVPGLLMPVAHTLLQVLEDLDHIAVGLTSGQLNAGPRGVAPPGFHLRHIANSIDRLSTYARGEMLSEQQRRKLQTEDKPGDESLDDLLKAVRESVNKAIKQLEATPEEELLKPRRVGRMGLPSNTVGLLFHLAEHAARHAGQLITTVKVMNTTH